MNQAELIAELEAICDSIWKIKFGITDVLYEDEECTVPSERYDTAERQKDFSAFQDIEDISYDLAKDVRCLINRLKEAQ